MLRSLAAALALAGVVMTLSGDEASARQACAVTDTNPCSAPSGPWNVHAQRGTIHGYARSSTARSCLTGQTRAVLDRLEARVGKVSIISTCRPGSVIAGTRRPSYHRYGMAVDFKTPRKAEAVAFLRTQRVFVMTYSTHKHIHFNTGQSGVKLGANGYGRSVSARRRR